MNEWEEPRVISPVKKGINYYLHADEDEFNVDEALAFVKEIKMELAIQYATIEAIKKLEKKCKEAIRATGEIPEVEGVIVKFGKPSTRTMVHTKKLIDMAASDPVPPARERMEELHHHMRTKKGEKILQEIRAELSRHIPLHKYIYQRDISPRITIET